MKYVTTIGGTEFIVDVVDPHHVSLNGTLMDVDFENISGQPVYSLVIDGKSYEAYVYEGDEELQVLLLGHQFPVQVEDEREKRLKAAAGGRVSEAGEFHLKAPMPGLVVAIPVQQDEQVTKGQVLLILESMKMQMQLRSPRAGKVAKLTAQPGSQVEKGACLVQFE